MDKLSPESLLHQLEIGTPSFQLICMTEIAKFDEEQEKVLLPLLWKYILEHRSNSEWSIRTATCSAIRKYISILPMERMGELTVLLEPGTPQDIEIEVTKMIFRNYEVFPPNEIDLQPELASLLMKMATAYTNHRILLRKKYSAAASLAIEALFAMRSSLASEAFRLMENCPYTWFIEMVRDDLDELFEAWNKKNPEAAVWLKEIKDTKITPEWLHPMGFLPDGDKSNEEYGKRVWSLSYTDDTSNMIQVLVSLKDFSVWLEVYSPTGESLALIEVPGGTQKRIQRLCEALGINSST